MGRNGNQAMQWAFGAVAPATSPRLAGHDAARITSIGRLGRGPVLRGLDGGASAGWEARAAYAVGAAMAHWLSTIGVQSTEKG
jgi:hypothetical protein